MTSVCLKGDCLELMKDLSNNSIDLFICDLPYGCLAGATETTHKRIIDGKDTGTTIEMYKGGCAWDVKIDLNKFWFEVKRLSKNDKTPVLMFCNTKFGADLINSNPSWFRYDLVWNKTRGISFLSANKMPMKCHEMIYVFSKKGCHYNRTDEFIDGKDAYTRKRASSSVTYALSKIEADKYTLKKPLAIQEEGMRCVLSIINISMKRDKKHTTAKPIELYDWLIKRYSNEGDTILDPTAGSFNSGRSALGLERNYIGMEMNDEFYNNNKLE